MKGCCAGGAGMLMCGFSKYPLPGSSITMDATRPSPSKTACNCATVPLSESGYSMNTVGAAVYPEGEYLRVTFPMVVPASVDTSAVAHGKAHAYAGRRRSMKRRPDT